MDRLPAAAVAAELDEPTGDTCPATFTLSGFETGDHDMALGCAVRPAGHPPPHRDPRGLAWDGSVVTRAWPQHAAAGIVAELLAAHQAAQEDRWASEETCDRWTAARDAAVLLPGVGELLAADGADAGHLRG